MEWHVIQFQNISISHLYIETEYCTWSDVCYSFRISVYLTWILKQFIEHWVTCDSLSEYQYISHVYWNRLLYMEWNMTQFQNISRSHMYIEILYCTWSDMWCSFRTSVYLKCILKQNIVRGLKCDTVSEHQYTSHMYWNIIFYMEWRVIEFQNNSISHMYTETEYCTLSDMWYSFRTSVYLTCILKQNIVHGVTCDTVSEHQYISHVYWNSILYMEWHMIQFQNIRISHMYI